MPSELEIRNNQQRFITQIERSPFDFFEEIGCIGKGNFSSVYKVRSRSDQQEYALKKLNSNDNIEAFVEFAESVVTPSENLLKHFALYFNENTYYILQELMKCSLREFIRNTNKLPEDVILYILREITKGLAFLHNSFKIHRDLKTENVFLSFSGEIKVGDFGSVAQLTQENVLRSTLTGTPLYLAPEIVMGRNYSLEVDIWSLGIIAHELLYKDTPFCDCSNIYQLGQRINSFSMEVVKKSDYKKVDEFIKSCLNPDPSQRTSTNKILECQLYKVNNERCRSFIQNIIRENFNNSL
jgi:serine/threonine protein kinase